MYDRETVELALYAVEDGMSRREAAALAGCTVASLGRWPAGRIPHERAGGGGMSGRPRREEDPVDESEREAYEAAMAENMLLGAVLADLKAAGWAPASISNGRKAELGERLRAATGRPLREITRFLGISKSSCEYHRARLGRGRGAGIRGPVREAFGASGGAYGCRRVHAGLARRGIRASERRVRRVMAEEGLEARSTARSPRRHSSYRGEPGRAAAPSLLLRPGARGSHDFSAPAPGTRLATDVTGFRLGPRGPKCYLSAAVGLCDGRVAAWAAGPSPSKALVQGMLAQLEGRIAPGCVVRSDRGWHYGTPGWVAACASMGAVRSMSRKGCSPDNAACEGLFGRPKVGPFHLSDWSGWTPGRFAAEPGRYISWYNSGRLKSFGPGRYDTMDGRRAGMGLAA